MIWNADRRCYRPYNPSFLSILPPPCGAAFSFFAAQRAALYFHLSRRSGSFSLIDSLITVLIIYLITYLITAP